MILIRMSTLKYLRSSGLGLPLGLEMNEYKFEFEASPDKNTTFPY